MIVALYIKQLTPFFSQEDSIRDLASHRNEFNLRTEKSRTRVELAVRRSFLQFYNQDHKDLIRSYISKQHAIVGKGVGSVLAIRTK